MLREVSLETGLPTVSEVTDPRHVDACVSNVDMLQIGTRSMSNFELLVEVGRSGHPVLLKRGMMMTKKTTMTSSPASVELVQAHGQHQVKLMTMMNVL